MTTVPTKLGLKEAYDLYSKHTDSAHKLWTYFSAVSLAVLGYTIGKDKVSWAPEMFLVIGGSYLVFSLSNLWVLQLTQRECEQFAKLLNSVAGEQDEPKQGITVKSAPVCGVIAFHLFAQAAVFVAIYLTWENQPSPSPAKPPLCCVPAQPASVGG